MCHYSILSEQKPNICNSDSTDAESKKNRHWQLLWMLPFFFYAVCSFTLYTTPEKDLDQADWNTVRLERHYKNLAEERFQMECDYLGIKGERKKKARELFELSQQQRELVKKKRLERKITARGAIQKLNQIDIKYYEKLAPLIAGKKNNTKLGRILDKLRKKSTDQCDQWPGCIHRIQQ